MSKADFIKKVHALGLDPKDYIVVGSGLLVALDIRQADDIDLIVTPDVFAELEASGEWTRKDFDDGTYYLLNGIYELGMDWDSVDIQPNLDDLKADQIVIEGVPFVSAQRLMSWKRKKGTKKHLKDVKLIEAYLASN